MAENEELSNEPLEGEQQEGELASKELSWQERNEVANLQGRVDMASGSRPKRVIRKPMRYLE